jgi:hypothetical protein
MELKGKYLSATAEVYGVLILGTFYSIYSYMAVVLALLETEN